MPLVFIDMDHHGMDDESSPIIPLSYKEQKEAFVTGHDGTTPWEVLLVCLSAPIGVACYQQVARGNNNILLEALLVWFPMVLCQTNFLYPYGVGILTIQSTIVLRGLLQKKKSLQSSNITPVKLGYLTAYRSSILYLTFVAILAVDFHVFPRRFAKTEVSGYGLMDVGAASFCLSAGLVSRPAKHATAANRLNIKQVLHTLPLVIIGLLRTWTNKELDYQEHVSEYGVHWNFFFTMGVMAMVPSLVPWRGTWILPAFILVFYQLALSVGNLQEYIETAPRICDANDTTCIGFVAANREGILGCLGYLSLFFIGEYVGRNFLWKHQSLWKPTAGLSLLFLVSSQVITVSRRSTNLTFCLWAAAHNILLLALCQLILVENGHFPIVLETVNRVALPIFLIANLLTGFVNLTIPTLEVADVPALLVVFGYICLVGAAAMAVDWAVRTVFGKATGTTSATNVERKKKD